jgi:pimeloyl-ACP methyl ester carboxylesterase
MTLHAIAWGKGPPFTILLHGLGGCAHIWMRFVGAISLPGTIVAFDLPGHGDSDWFRMPYTVRDLAACTREAIQMLEINSALIVGHSLGAYVALDIAADTPDAVQGLVLVEGGTFPRAEANAAVLGRVDKGPRKFLSADVYVNAMARAWPLAPREAFVEVAPAMLRDVAAGVLELKNDPETSAAMEGACDSFLTAQARRVTCPTLVVRGRWSSVLPKAAAQRWAGLFENGSLVEVADAGHAPPMENPVQLARSVERFSGQVDPVTIAS